MSTPKLEINLQKIIYNAKKLKQLYGSKGVNVIGVTKGVNGNISVAKALVKSGITMLADSRIANIKKMRKAGVKAKFVLLRLPFLSQVQETIKHVDISLNSEITTIRNLSKCALANNSVHKIVLMIELGDLREGLLPSDIDCMVEQILSLHGVELIGIGTNLACFGGVKPDNENMDYLSLIARDIETKFGLNLWFISGGNSANYNWFIHTKKTGKINNLRLGESIFLGTEPLYNTPIPYLFTDAFLLSVEVIELKTKRSVPYGEICQDAFGNIPDFKDEGIMRRAILGIGAQDVAVSGLIPTSDIDILGASSDHLVINAKESKIKVGDNITFTLNYSALLSAIMAPHISKKTVNS